MGHLEKSINCIPCYYPSGLTFLHFVYVNSFKICFAHQPRLKGSFSDPTFTLQVSFLDIQGPYSYLVTTGATFLFFGPRFPAITRSSQGFQSLLGSAGDAGALRPPQPPPALTKTLLLISDKARQPSGTWGSCKRSRGGGQRSVSCTAPRESGGGGWGNPWVQLKTSRD